MITFHLYLPDKWVVKIIFIEYSLDTKHKDKSQIKWLTTNSLLKNIDQQPISTILEENKADKNETILEPAKNSNEYYYGLYSGNKNQNLTKG